MPQFDDFFDRFPLRYFVLASVCGAVIYSEARATPWHPFWSYNNDTATAFWTGTLPLFWILLGLAPLAAIRWPLPAAVAASLPLGLGALVPEHEWPVVSYACLLVISCISIWNKPRWGIAIAAYAVLPVLAMATQRATILIPYGAKIDARDVDHGSAIVLVYAVVAALAVGLGFWLRMDALRAQRSRQLVAREAHVEGQAAVVDERARLARDLHDVIAHHVSLIAVRAETAPYTEPDIGVSAKGVLSEIGAEARLALDELRGVLGVLGRSNAAERTPQPTWDDLSDLVLRSREAGLDISASGPNEQVVNAHVGYVAYRVAQEALTNARRHGAGSPTTFLAVATAEQVRVRIANQAPATTSAAWGNGLNGMRERVESLGGQLDVFHEDGLFVVEASLPNGRSS